jgi:hypothetical protein
VDLSRLTLGSKLVAGVGALLLVDSFLHWQEVSFGPISAGVSMWHGIGVVGGLLVLIILVWEAAQLVGIKAAVGPLSPSMVTMALSALLVLLTLIKVVTNNFVTAWAWIGLLLSAGIAVGAWLNMKAAGESITDLKSSVTSAASKATSSAKTAGASPSVAPTTPPASSTTTGVDPLDSSV